MIVRTSVAVVLFLCVMVHSGVPHTEKAEKTLIQVHTIFRHGESAPVVSFPKDPNHSEENWENGFGQLTKEGIKQHFNLGQFFRHRYSNFLSPKWRNDDVKVQSSDQERCLNSAAANTAGLFYDSLRFNKIEMFKSGLPWSLVPIHTVPSNLDYLIDTDKSCDKLKELLHEMETESDVQKHFDDAKPMLSELQQKIDTKVDNITEEGMMYDNSKIQEQNNMSIPDFVKPMMPKLEELELSNYEILGKTNELKRLHSGPIISKILTDFQAKVESPPTTPKMFMYSGHDTTVAGNLKALGWFNGIKPPFASAVIYELHQKEDGQNYVKIFYQNDTSFSSQLHEIFLTNCFNNCTLYQFRMIMTPLIPGDIMEECQIKNPYDTLLYSFSALLLICLLVWLIYTETKSKKLKVSFDQGSEIGYLFLFDKSYQRKLSAPNTGIVISSK